MVIKCPKCGAENSDKHMHCAACGSQTQEVCPVCHCLHPVTATFCPNSGENIAEYKAKVERKKEVEKEFDEIFPEAFRKECLLARWKAFINSAICYEFVFLVIWWSAIRHTTDLEQAFTIGFTIFVAVLVLASTWITTSVSYNNKREQLLDRYVGLKIRGEKE